MKEIAKLTPKESFLKQFDEVFGDEFLPKDWDESKKKRVAFLTSPTKTKTTMFTSIPMICKGAKCIFSSTCPLFKEDLAPEDHPCPIEFAFVRDFMSDYIDQLEIDPDNLVEVSQVRNLVDQEVQYIRKTKLLAKEDFIQEYVVGVGADGEPVLGKGLHHAVAYEDKILKHQAQLYKQMIATRQDKAKIGIGILEASSSQSNLMSAFKDLQFRKDELLKEKLGIVDVDEYTLNRPVIDDDDDEG